MGLCSSDLSEKDRCALLKKIPFFHSMKDEHIMSLSKQFMVRCVDKGQIIMNEGACVDQLYVLAEGKVQFEASSPESGRAIHLGTKTAPDMFGEISLGKGRVGAEARPVRHTTVTACEPVSHVACLSTWTVLRSLRAEKSVP